MVSDEKIKEFMEFELDYAEKLWDAAKKIPIPEVQRGVAIMAADSINHAFALQKLSMPSIHPSRLADYQIMNMLTMFAKEEHALKEKYKKIAKETDDSAQKSTFEWLVNEEERHEVMANNMLRLMESKQKRYNK